MAAAASTSSALLILTARAAVDCLKASLTEPLMVLLPSSARAPLSASSSRSTKCSAISSGYTTRNAADPRANDRLCRHCESDCSHCTGERKHASKCRGIGNNLIRWPRCCRAVVVSFEFCHADEGQDRAEPIMTVALVCLESWGCRTSDSGRSVRDAGPPSGRRWRAPGRGGRRTRPGCGGRDTPRPTGAPRRDAPTGRRRPPPQ